MSKAGKLPETLIEAIRYFADLDVANEYVAMLRWPNGPECPTCGGKELGYISTRRLWKCKNKECRRQFSVKVGTIFEDSPIPLDKWLASIWMIANSKNGVSSYELGRHVGLTQKSAWFVNHRIRLAMQMGSFQKFSGEVEVDETFIGGRARFMHKSVRARRITSTGGKGQGRSVRRGRAGGRSSGGSNAGCTQADPRPGRSAARRARSERLQRCDLRLQRPERRLRARTVDHAIEYVRGQVHTNTIENFWSLLKRGLKGTYVSVQPFHLFRYLDERVFAFNRRDLTDLGRFSLVLAHVAGRRLTYSVLTGKTT